MIFIFFPFLTFSRVISYGSSIHLKSVYTKNRLTINSSPEVGSKSKIFTSRPPFNTGWLWTIESDSDDEELVHHIVDCGSVVSFSSTSSEFYLSTRKRKSGLHIEPTPINQGAESQWKVQCKRNETSWEQGDDVFLINLKHKCYLSTDFEERIGNNKFRVFCDNRTTKYAVWKVAEGIFIDNEESADFENTQEPINEEL